MRKPIFFLLSICLSIYGAWVPVFAKLQGQELIDSLLTVLPHMTEDTAKVSAVNKISFSYRTVDPSRGIGYGKSSLELATKLNWEKGKEDAYNALGANYAASSDFGTATVYFDSALAIASRLGNRTDEGGLLMNIGVISYYQGNYPRALEYYLKDLAIQEQTGDRREVAYAWENIGNVYNAREMGDKALYYWQKALAVFDSLSDKQNQSYVLNGIATYYYNVYNYARCLEYNAKVVNICRETGDKFTMANAMTMIGKVYLDEHEYKKAFEYTDKAVMIKQGMGANETIGADLNNLADIFLAAAGDSIPAGTIESGEVITFPANKTLLLRRALLYSDSAVSLLKTIGDLRSLSLAYFNSYRAKSLLGDQKGALESYVGYISYRDSVDNMETRTRMFNLETQRELDIRDRQIQIDQLEVEKKRNERKFYIAGMVSLVLLGLFVALYLFYRYRINRLRELYKVRSGIAKDLHDEIGSTLTSINILSRASASGLADDQHKSLEMMNTVSEQSQQMQQSMSDIVWAINPANDKVENILVRMREYIARTLEPLNINVGFKVTRETEKNVLSMNERKDLLYVFKEAINNISKHAQCRNVNIELNKDKEATVLTITDDGLGFDPEMVTSSSGIKNMKNRIGLLGGNISITSEANKGTIITIRIPAGQDATS